MEKGAREMRTIGNDINYPSALFPKSFNRSMADDMANKKATLTINDIPPSLNVYQNMHWHKRNREKKNWHDLVYGAWLEAGKPKFDKAEIQVTYYFKTHHKRDEDNYNSKWLLDGLKGYVFGDDNSDIVHLLPPIFNYDKKQPRTVIEIKECNVLC